MGIERKVDLTLRQQIMGIERKVDQDLGEKLWVLHILQRKKMGI